ncbi:hypothetical protein H6761_00470 [Candidatus Nomurabacteria bacterium]|nr:hypothetical protein [Candidatus Nomurabacteria bacterium]
MFEHLVSQHHQNFEDNKKWRFKFYASFFLLGVFIFTSLWININSGPKSSAQTNLTISSQKAKVFALNKSSESKFVLNSPKVSVFDFAIEVEETSNLQKLVFDLEGFSDLSMLDDLILYKDKTQISSDVQLQDQRLVFNFSDYSLAKGTNYFHLSLANIDQALLGQKAKFILTDQDNLQLSLDNQSVEVIGNFPISSAGLLVIDQAQLFSYNNLNAKTFSIASGVYSQLADFSLSTQGEAVALQKISFDFTGHQELTDFYLASHGKIIASTKASDLIEFILKEDALVKINEDLNLELWASLSAGQYQLNLKNIQAKGFVSGKQISLAQNLVLSEVKVLDNLIVLENQTNNQSLSEGWNTLFDLNLKSQASAEKTKIHKLAWEIKNLGANLEKVELWSGSDFLASAKIVNDQAVFVFWNQDLILDQNLDLQLIAKVKFLADDAQVQVRFLNDQKAISEDNSANNFLWSLDGILYNSYLMPGLPLAPVILN